MKIEVGSKIPRSRCSSDMRMMPYRFPAEPLPAATFISGEAQGNMAFQKSSSPH
jgi:hypothetical protein